MARSTRLRSIARTRRCTPPTGSTNISQGTKSSLGRLKAILGGSAGNLVEWYDWFAYASFSLYFAKVFFPHGDATEQLLQTAAVFAAGFLARPVGAWLMGVYADRAGRKAAIHCGLAVVGTIGLLEQAAARGLVELAPTLARLRQTNARLDPGLIQAALACDQARRQKRS